MSLINLGLLAWIVFNPFQGQVSLPSNALEQLEIQLKQETALIETRVNELGDSIELYTVQQFNEKTLPILAQQRQDYQDVLNRLRKNGRDNDRLIGSLMVKLSAQGDLIGDLSKLTTTIAHGDTIETYIPLTQEEKDSLYAGPGLKPGHIWISEYPYSNIATVLGQDYNVTHAIRLKPFTINADLLQPKSSWFGKQKNLELDLSSDVEFIDFEDVDIKIRQQRRAWLVLGLGTNVGAYINTQGKVDLGAGIGLQATVPFLTFYR